MRYLFAIDTTGEFGSLALFGDGALLEEMPLHSADGFGHVLFGAIQALLARHHLTVADISCFAGATGPGSFTGVRVGLTAVKGLAEAAGQRPVVGVSNLKAMASFGHKAQRATLLDARRGEVYAALYDAKLELLQPETVIRFSDWLTQLPDSEIEFLAQDFTPFAASLEGRLLTPVHRSLAAAIGALAWQEFDSGRAVDPAVLDANYVRRSDAELYWKEIA